MTLIYNTWRLLFEIHLENDTHIEMYGVANT